MKNRKNGEIEAPNVMLINSDGEKIGIVKIEEALAVAEKTELDLVEVKGGHVPVCKLMDENKNNYKKRKLHKKTNRPQKTKEIKIKTTIAPNDLKVKATNISKNLKLGHRIKLMMQSGGRSTNDFRKEAEKKIEELIKMIEIPFKKENRVNNNRNFVVTTLIPSS